MRRAFRILEVKIFERYFELFLKVFLLFLFLEQRIKETSLILLCYVCFLEEWHDLTMGYSSLVNRYQ